MSEENINHVIYTRNIIEFVTVANEYCKFVENVTSIPKKDFIEKAQKMLALLYLKSSILPQVEDISGEETEKFVTEADWHFINESISSKFGENEIFSELIEPLTPESPINISLSESFTDIYQDLKDFVTLYQIGSIESINEALFECKSNFEQIWGPRIIVALKEIHTIIYSRNDLHENESSEYQNDSNNTPNKNEWLNDFFKEKS